MLTKENTGNTKGLIEKHIYSSNRNKIQVNLIKQLVESWESSVVSHVIVSRSLVHSIWHSHWYVFMEEGESIM